MWFLLFLQLTSGLRIMQYNVEFLFLNQHSGCPGSKCDWQNRTIAQIHADKVSEIIHKHQPDILNLCEVGGEYELQYLNYSTPYFIQNKDTATGQNVALLSNLPVTNLYRNETRINYEGGNLIHTTGVSKHYITEFKYRNYKVGLIGIHLIAMPTDPVRVAQREAQAIILNGIVENFIQNNYEVMLIGDFNDYDGDILDINSHKPTSNVLSILKSHLFSVMDKVDQKERYTNWYDEEKNCKDNLLDYSMIDHVLMTKHLLDLVSNVSIDHSYLEYCGKLDSDHYPIIINIL